PHVGQAGQGVGLTELVPRVTAEGQRPLVGRRGGGELPPVLLREAEVVERVRLPVPLPQLAVAGDSLVVGPSRPRELIRVQAGVAQVAQRVSLTEPVTEIPCGPYRGGVPGDGVAQ